MSFEEDLEGHRQQIRASNIIGPNWIRIRLAALSCVLFALLASYCAHVGQSNLETVFVFLAGASGAYALLHIENKRLYVDKPPVDRH